MEFTDLLNMMAEKKASDLFITTDMPPALKVNGVITPVSNTPLNNRQTRELVLSIMNPEQRQEFLDTKECQFAIQTKDAGRFRVSAFFQRDDIGMVLRRIECLRGAGASGYAKELPACAAVLESLAGEGVAL